MKKRLSWLLTSVLVATIIAGCSPESSPPNQETGPTSEPEVTAAAAKAAVEAETTAILTPSPTARATLVESETSSESGSTAGYPPIESSLETPPVLELAPTSVIKNNPAIQEVIVTDPFSPTIPAPGDPGIQGWITQAKKDLDQRLGIQIEKIDLISFELRVWSDAGLGCPQPGMNYIQVPQDGYLIVLRADGRLYNYHGGGSGDPSPFLCENFTGNDEFLPPPSIDE